MSLNWWQRTVLIGIAALILFIQLQQFDDNGVEGSGWIFSFLCVGGLVTLALSRRALSVGTSTRGPVKPMTADAAELLGATQAMASRLMAHLLKRKQAVMLTKGVPFLLGDDDMVEMLRAQVEHACQSFCFGLLLLLGTLHDRTYLVSPELLRAKFKFIDLSFATLRRASPRSSEEEKAAEQARMAVQEFEELKATIDRCIRLPVEKPGSNPMIPLFDLLAERSHLWEECPKDPASLENDLGTITRELWTLGAGLLGVPEVRRQTA